MEFIVFRVLQSWKFVGLCKKNFLEWTFWPGSGNVLNVALVISMWICELLWTMWTFVPFVSREKCTFSSYCFFEYFTWGRWRIYFNYYCIKLDFVNAKPILTTGHDYSDLLEKNFGLCKSQTMDRFQMMVSPNLWGRPIVFIALILFFKTIKICVCWFIQMFHVHWPFYSGTQYNST